MSSTKDNKILGTLCRRGHDHNGTGKSLRYKCGHNPCVECNTINARRNREDNPERYNAVKARYREKNRAKANAWHRNHYAENIEKIKARHARNYQDNKERVLERTRARFNKDRPAAYRRQNNYMKAQRANNTQLAIGVNLRHLVWQAFKRYTTTGKIMVSSKYGIDYKAIIEHLGPHPNTRGIEGKFHIDHIIPVSAFDINDLEQVKIAFAPSNHRWLLAHENRFKNANMPSLDIVPVELLAMLDNHNLGVMTNG